MANHQDALSPEKTIKADSEMSGDEQLDLAPAKLELKRNHVLRVRSVLRAGPPTVCGKNAG